MQVGVLDGLCRSLLIDLPPSHPGNQHRFTVADFDVGIDRLSIDLGGESGKDVGHLGIVHADDRIELIAASNPMHQQHWIPTRSGGLRDGCCRIEGQAQLRRAHGDLMARDAQRERGRRRLGHLLLEVRGGLRVGLVADVVSENDRIGRHLI